MSIAAFTNWLIYPCVHLTSTDEFSNFSIGILYSTVLYRTHFIGWRSFSSIQNDLWIELQFVLGNSLNNEWNHFQLALKRAVISLLQTCLSYVSIKFTWNWTNGSKRHRFPCAMRRNNQCWYHPTKTSVTRSIINKIISNLH